MNILRNAHKSNVGANGCSPLSEKGGHIARMKAGRPAGSPLQVLPEGWVWKTLGESSTVILGQSPESATYNTDGIGLPFFQGKAEFGDRFPIVMKWCSHPKKTAKKNDILISVRAPVGPTNLAPSECCIGRGLAALRPSEGVNHLYLLHYLRNIEHELSEMGSGTTFKAISGDVLRSIEVPIAPLDQQHLIASEIEKQFSRLDEAVAGLKRIKANLKRYKAAVLKATVEGKLTEEWRSRRGERPFAPTENETGAELLKRILAERKRKWEAEHPGKKYKEPSSPDIPNLPELPKGWVWSSVGQIAESMKNGIYKPLSTYSEDGTACLRMYNIENGRIVWKDIKRMSLSREEVMEYQLLPGDLLVNRVNSRELVGKAAPIPKGLEVCVFESKNIRVRLFSEMANSKYVSHVFSVTGQNFFNRNAQQVVGMASISQPQVSALPIPLPPVSEQNIIIDEVESRLSIIDEVKMAVEINLSRAERLRQAILKKAFSGNLVRSKEYVT